MSVGNPVDLSEFDTPGRGHGVLDVFRRRYLLKLLLQKGTSTRYRNSVLGWVWSYVKPGAQFLIYFFVLGIVLGMHRNVEAFPVYMFSGIVVINMFTEAFGNATKTIVDNKALVKKIYLPRELFPIAAIIGAFIHSLPQWAILLVVCIFMGWVPSVLGVLGILLGAVIVLLFSLGLGLIFGGLNVRYRDAQNVVDLIKMFSTWTSPVLYSFVMISEVLQDHQLILSIYSCNPITVAVSLFHGGFWGQIGIVRHTEGAADVAAMPNPLLSILVAVALSLVLVVVGQLVFRHFERSFAQDL